MSKKPRKVEVPGAVAPVTNGQPQAPDPSQDQARTDALNAQVQATQGLVGSDKALDWGHLTTPYNILKKIGNPDDDLPEPEDIDWATQPKGVRQVLTRQGWLIKPD